ncbi:MAG: hypothetical protein AAF291_16085 [Pseudomonadota bacterium]
MIITTLTASLFFMQASPEPETGVQKAADTQETLSQDEQPGPPAEPTFDPSINVVEEKPEKITDRSHPDFVRCKSEAVIGSRARRKRTCMTNREWTLAQRKGNELSRDIVRDTQPGMLFERPAG